MIREAREGESVGKFEDHIQAFERDFRILGAIYEGSYERENFPGQTLTAQEQGAYILSKRYPLAREYWNHLVMMEKTAKSLVEKSRAMERSDHLRRFIRENQLDTQLLFDPFNE